MKGISLAILRTVAKQLGFTYEIMLASDWYSVLPNGTFGGSLGDVKNILSDSKIIDLHYMHSPLGNQLTKLLL